MTVYQYGVALGWNQPEGSLTNLEAISVSGAVLSLSDVLDRYEIGDNTHFLASGRKFPEIELQLAGDATLVQNGRINKSIEFLFVSDKALNYWIDTYEGQKVTFKMPLRQFNSYTRYNVTVGQAIAETAEYLQGTWWYQNVQVPLYIQGTAT